MTATKCPPFKADIVGSLLRPAAIHQARAKMAAGELSRDDVWSIESNCIAEAVALQKNAGLRAATDGEFHRRHWFMDFIERIDGVGFGGGLPTRFQTEDGVIEFAPPKVMTTGKLRRTKSLAGRDFDDLKPVADKAGVMAKQAIPSPTLVHFRSGDPGVDRQVYPDIEEYYADLAQVYREEIRALYDSGCRYVQIDETNFPFLCDPNMHEHVRSIGEDPKGLQLKYRDLLNAVTREKPQDLTIAMHMCRGNHESAWAAAGAYDFIAETAFGGLDIDAFFLEYDTERAGGFEPLRHLREGTIAVLGLVTSKKPELEDADTLKRRIDEASRFVPLERLAISPQCGFASTIGGNKLSLDDVRRKLDLCVSVAIDVWGDV